MRHAEMQSCISDKALNGGLTVETKDGTEMLFQSGEVRR